MSDNTQLPLDAGFMKPLEDKALRERLKEIRARHAHANPGPWIIEKGEHTGTNWMVADFGRCERDGKDYSVQVTTDCVNASRLCGDAEDDAQFAAHARTDVPWLVEQIEKMMEGRHE